MNRILPLALLGTLLASTAWAASPAPSSSTPVQVAQTAAAAPAATKEKPRAAKWVKQAQEQLKAAGYDAGKADGVIGKKTRAAVKAFQTAKGLKVNGRLDTATRTALKG